MQVVYSSQEMTALLKGLAGVGTIALVPTMGCFHEGHLQLMRMAREKADYVVVSLFVNPTQFGPNEDFSCYPRPFEHDRAAAELEGVDYLFSPSPDDMYPLGFQSSISVKLLTQGLCGRDRPGHFCGVTTVVGKLFNIVNPDIAIFGEKDFQQLAVIRRMVSDLSWDIEVVGHPIVRESDGLAMSSRNKYLSESERNSARRLSQLIALLRSEVKNGQKDVAALLVLANTYLKLDKTIKTDYLEIIDADNLAPQKSIDDSSVVVMAVKIGATRLLDNGALVHLSGSEKGS